MAGKLKVKVVTDTHNLTVNQAIVLLEAQKYLSLFPYKTHEEDKQKLISLGFLELKSSVSAGERLFLTDLGEEIVQNMCTVVVPKLVNL